MSYSTYKLLPSSTYFDPLFFSNKKLNTINFKFGLLMKFVDRCTLSRHNPAPPSRDTFT